MTLNSYNGITPSGYKVLIETDVIQKTLDPDGRIELPDEIIEQYQNAQPTGVVRAIGPEAWADRGKPWAHPGDRVAFDKYTGIIINDKAGTEFRLVNDTGVLCQLDKDIKLGSLERRTKYER